MSLHIDSSSDKEQRDLHETVIRNMEHPALNGTAGKQRSTENNNRKVVDGRECKPSLYIVLCQCEKAAYNNSERDKIG